MNRIEEEFDDNETSTCSIASSGNKMLGLDLDNIPMIDEDEDKAIVAPNDHHARSLNNSAAFLGAKRKTKRPNALKLSPLNTSTNSGNNNYHPESNGTATSPIKNNGNDQLDGRKRRSRISKPLDISFRNLSYSVTTGFFKREQKQILQSINGDFKSGELTAIMGPSGAGKSTLMDILTGYTTAKVAGRVTVNGQERDLRRYRRQTAYIMQDHDLQPMLTVMEAMHFSTNLRIGDELSPLQKKTRIQEILEAIALYENRKTKTGQLSGGQKKRLAIALELVTNPPIMFFDEPTSGLDSSTSTQCVSMLKKLAQEGRTIICTIHQPSALVFRMFDHLFAIAEGKCIYSGGTQYLIPFLSALDLKCPEFYNPSDYLLEISTNDYGFQNDRLVEKTENGLSTKYRSHSTHPSTSQIAALHKVEEMMANGLMTPIKAPEITESSIVPPTPVIGYKKEKEAITSLDIESKPKIVDINDKKSGKCCKNDERYPTSFFGQMSILLLRTFLILYRDRTLATMRLLIHLLMAPLIGVLYFGIGNEASHALNNYKYAFFSIMFLSYTAFSSIVLNFPLELPIITREYFNRWYSLKAYYVAMTLADVPIQVACIFLFTSITYLMTNQPMEFYRFGLFSICCLCVCFVSQSIGLVVGSLFTIKNGAVFGQFFILPFLIFSGFFIHLEDAHEYMHWLFHISFYKYALEGCSLAIFGYERPKMPCDKIFCRFRLPDEFMRFLNMDEANYWHVLIALSVIFFIFRFSAYYIMLYRLRNNN